MGANDSILDILENGYRIPLKSEPQSCFLKNNKSALERGSFVENEIQELLNSGRIREVDQPPYLVNPLSVSTNGSKNRLILVLSWLNLFVYKEKIKFDDWKAMLHFVEKGVYLFKFDISQGYHHIDLSDEHQKYMGFSWEINGKVRYFVFTVLPLV